MEKIELSIIINCYNGAKYLRDAIECVRAQTWQNWELILWDNVSFDNSASIFNAYNDKRFRYIKSQIHTNLGQARNNAVKESAGNWIAFLDVDDIWLPEKISRQVEEIKKSKNEIGFVYCGATSKVEKDGLNTYMGKNMSGRKSDIPKLPSGRIFPKLLKTNFVPLSSAIIKKTAFERVGGINACLKQAEDYDIFLKIAKDYEVASVSDPLVIYRIHSGNLTHTQQEENFLEAVEILREYLPNPAAHTGITNNLTSLAIYYIRNKRIIDGLCILLKEGSLFSLCKKMARRIKLK